MDPNINLAINTQKWKMRITTKRRRRRERRELNKEANIHSKEKWSLPGQKSVRKWLTMEFWRVPRVISIFTLVLLDIEFICFVFILFLLGQFWSIF